MSNPMAGSRMPPTMPNQILNPQQFQSVMHRINHLRANPMDGQPGEMENLMRAVASVNQQRQIAQNAQISMMNGGPPLNGTGPAPHVPPQSVTPVSFTPDQIDVLRAQIAAFKAISRQERVPDHVRKRMLVTGPQIADLEKQLRAAGAPDVDAKIVDSVVNVAKVESDASGISDIAMMEVEDDGQPEPTDLPTGPFLEEDTNSGIYPYNAYRHPFSHLKRQPDIDPKAFATHLQRLLVPSIMPAGLDVNQIMQERDRYVDVRIQQRMSELEELPSTAGEGGLVEENLLEDDKQLLFQPSHGKLRALIELKSLRLVEKQRAMRQAVAERLVHGSMLPVNRADFKRARKPTLRDTRQTETLERNQRAERERRAKHKHVEQLRVITNHGREILNVNRAAQDRVNRLGKAVLAFHVHTEKEEQKRIERISKERLKALKADDEEAYMKLIDTAKDTRITHLLKQTDAYLEGLAQAVVAQQNESGGVEMGNFEQESGPTSEATFGAQVDEDAKKEKGKVDYYSVAHRISEKITAQPQILVGGKLKEYQLKGLQWMVSLYNNRLNGILADEMGLGKTIQTISLISFLIESKNQPGPFLVIVPLSTLTNWSGEFAKWAPAIRMISYKGNPAQRRALQNDLRPGYFQVLLTTYEYIIKDRPVLSKFRWVHMIIDEGHRMKNTQSKLSQTLSTFYHTRHRLILTGTPLQNNLPELWSLLNFVLPKIFNSVKSFDEWFNTPFANTGDKIELNEEEALLIIRRLHKVLRPFLLRRLKKDVESELPDKVEKVLKTKMSGLQSQLYKQMKKYKMIAESNGKGGLRTAGIKGLSNELMQLRKICQHPFLFESVEDKVNPTGLIDDKLIRASGKLELLNRILPKFFATGHRVLIFFQMTKVMDIMEDFLKMMGWKYLRLDGGTKTEERASYVQLFNAKESEYKVFILSTRAGGLGLNLQTADTVIIFDSDWNPHADLQAQDRAHRIGQTKAVLILRFITEKSVEEAMYQRARFKLDIDDKVIQAGRFDNKSTQEEQEEFLRSILEADQEEDNEEAGDMNDEELNGLLARSEEEAAVFREYDANRERELAESWRNAGHRGKPPPPLMAVEELPELYRSDEPFAPPTEEEIVEGRGARKRNVVNYTDNLDDDTWARALEDGEDLEELERPRKKRGVAAATPRYDSGRGTPSSDIGVGSSRKPRGKKGKAPAMDYDTPTGSKRKRGGQKSLTPSVAGDDDDDDRAPRRRKAKVPEVSPHVRERMKAAFDQCYSAVWECSAEEGRLRRELFMVLPSKKAYADYYQLIKSPISMQQIQKRMTGAFYKTVDMFRADWKLMFSNARTYNQEGSWVYTDAIEMEKVFDRAYARAMNNSGLPGAPGLGPARDDDSVGVSSRPSAVKRGSGRKQVLSDDEDGEYLTPSDLEE
ncbi:SNF2-family ATP dependent chromatin remodeling factor snf21 [Cylindrobasidium torrendii FP15055 ss-10]|uniref:SNF2-family ATP dependent chromatin remodeling factor snf21 n=1 Tax=Cylindrobasidium torrendii FP15055 ss-10 TaxID=1314674 RepID=A0A0D7B1K9_9AGAR|nr:SNF2-family ATP dependent chromatin remodeling factor snf21 [Cylindrobasidium torrendii FP15055 ss-10]